ncbi:cyclic nucleotide-binding domain-containing protein [Thermodesulfobacteriota bacterium]
MAKQQNLTETIMSKAVIDLLIDIPMFDSLDPDELRFAASFMKFMEFKPSEIVFQEGDKGDYVCFVSEGSLNVVKKNEIGKQVVISSLGRGRSIGEISIISDILD